MKTGALPSDRYTGKLADARAGNLAGDPKWRLGLPVVFYKYELAKIARVFGKENILLRKFGQKELPGSDVVRDFLSIIGGCGDSIRIIAKWLRRENPSLSPEAIRVGTRVIRKLGANMPPGAVFQQKITPLLQAIPGTKSGLTEEERWIIRAASEKESAYLEKEWGVVFGDVEQPSSRPVVLTDAEVETLAAAVMKRAGWNSAPHG